MGQGFDGDDPNDDDDDHDDDDNDDDNLNVTVSFWINQAFFYFKKLLGQARNSRGFLVGPIYENLNFSK